MAWWMLPVATGLMAHQGAKAQNRAQEKANMAAATQTEWSPWTGMGQGKINADFRSPTASGLQGGLTGFLQGESIQSGMKSDALLDKQSALLDKQLQADQFSGGGLTMNDRPGLYKKSSWYDVG